MNFNLLKVVRAALPLMVLMLSACLGGGGGSPAPAVTTTTTGYTIGGAVSGLSGSVVLQDNGGDNFTVATAGNFTFASKVNNNTKYAVTVLTPPTGQTCSVSTGAGTVSGGNVTNVAVTCATNAYTVGGTVSGLTGSVVLQDNSGDNLSVSANGAYTFATKVAYGSPYSVTVLTQPANMSCSVASGTGTIALANISNVAITCAFHTQTVGGTVSGLNGSVVLQDNGADNSTVSVNGPFNFPTAVAYGSPYSVSVLSKPAAQHCGVTSGAGTIAGNVSNVGVACGNNQMGGAWQLGAALNLAPTVSTFAGVAGTFLDGTGALARFKSPQASVSDGTNLYVADYLNHAIRKIVIATGVVTTFAGSPTVAGSADGTGTAASFNTPIGITIDSTKTNLYVVDQGNQKIRQIVIATGAVSSLTGAANTQMAAGAVDGAGTGATFKNPNGITTDGTNLYVADTGNCTIRQITIATGAVMTLAGQVLVGGAADGVGTLASFTVPAGITYNAGTASLYVADTNNNKIRQIVIATQAVSSFAGSPIGASGAADGAGTAATFWGPSGITTDGTNLYVTDTGNNKIRQIVIATGAVTSLTGATNMAVTAGKANGVPASAIFKGPQGVSYDAANTSLFVADANNNDMRKITLGAGSMVTTLAGVMGPDGTGAAATFKLPGGTTTDGSNLYVADNQTIRQIVIATGAVTTLAGQAGVVGMADGTGTAATFADPTGITTDGTNLYVTDMSNNKIRQIVIATGVVSSLTGAANATVAAGAVDGAGTAASFFSPRGITTDGSNLYVADRSNRKIRQIVIATGVVSTLAGTGLSGVVNGAGTAATFGFPYGITTDGTNLYVADSGNNRIRQIVIATGVVSTLAGAGLGSADGVGTAATFSSPTGITTDGTNLYVTDTNNHKIRQIVIATGAVTSLTGAANTSMAFGAADGAGLGAAFYWPGGITTDGSSLYVTDTSNSTIRKIQ